MAVSITEFNQEKHTSIFASARAARQSLLSFSPKSKDSEGPPPGAGLNCDVCLAALGFVEVGVPGIGSAAHQPGLALGHNLERERVEEAADDCVGRRQNLAKEQLVELGVGLKPPIRSQHRIASTDQHPISMATKSGHVHGALGWCGAPEMRAKWTPK